MSLGNICGVAVVFTGAVAAAATATPISPTTCSGPMGLGYGTIIIEPDRGDGKVHGVGRYEQQGKPPFSAEFVGELRPDGSVELRHMDGTLWFDGVRVANGVFAGRYHNQFADVALDARSPCH